MNAWRVLVLVLWSSRELSRRRKEERYEYFVRVTYRRLFQRAFRACMVFVCLLVWLYVCLFGYEILSTAYKDEVWGIVQYVMKAMEEGERLV
jgi:hypothetical protein